MFFIGSLSSGGAERVVSILSNKFIDNGFEVEIILYYNRPIFYYINSRIKIKMIEKETNSTKIFINMKWLREYLKKCDGCLISFLAPFNMLAIVSSIGLKNPVIVADRVDPRFAPKKKILRVLRNILYSIPDAVVNQSIHNQEYFPKTIQKKSTIIYNPIDLRDNVGLALRTSKRKKIVSVGRLDVQKNQKMLIEAYCKICKLFPDYELVIYGEGNLRNELENFINKNGLENKVFLPGATKDIFKKIADSTLFVLSSDYEGMPNALIEAMCLGLPVISTKVSGAVDLIQDKKNGLLCDCGNVQELVDAMIMLLDNEQYRMQLGKNATKIQNQLQVDSIVNKWLDLIERIG